MASRSKASVSRVYAPDLLKKKRPVWFTPERDAFFLANKDVDPALLANEIGLSECFVRMYQRKIGARLCCYHKPRHKC